MNKTPMILTAGPSITGLEISYVNDAVKNGWNFQHSGYIRRFEDAFARFVGMKHALATSSCTGALHLALLALGIGPGHEVIVPELSWIAAASAVVCTGAVPVFADVEEDTWAICPESAIRAITPKTRAIMPVHLYGHPAGMDKIMEIAREHGLKVVEDAASSAGALYRGRPAGSFGDFSAFSFQGAKIMATGEGGMLLASDPALFERARTLANHGRDARDPFRSNEIGCKYKMSNLQAALGLAQLERIEELVEKKRQIFEWYRESLEGVKGITLGVERPGTRSNYWMTSIVLNGDAGVSREHLRQELYARGIDTRPFFHPLSSMPMFKSREEANPVAYRISPRGINLPSGHNLTGDQAGYVASAVREILKRG